MSEDARIALSSAIQAAQVFILRRALLPPQPLTLTADEKEVGTTARRTLTRHADLAVRSRTS
jgi:hypothetical protein